MINAGLVGTSLVYTLSLTGKDKAVVKGAGLGALMWVGLAGLLYRVGLNIKSKNPNSPLINLTLHLLFGTMCGYLITKLGDDSLFPNKNFKDQVKIPVVYSGDNIKP